MSHFKQDALFDRNGLQNETLRSALETAGPIFRTVMERA
jgi:hypothetical protein